MATNTTLPLRDEFENTTDGWVGAVQLAPNGEPKGVAVAPHGNVWLTEDEQILTANAPRSDDDNPFIERRVTVEGEDGKQRTEKLPPQLKLRTRGAVQKSRRPYGALDEPEAEAQVEAEPEREETGATPVPQDAAPEGASAAGEEVATPQAARGRRRRG